MNVFDTLFYLHENHPPANNDTFLTGEEFRSLNKDKLSLKGVETNSHPSDQYLSFMSPRPTSPLPLKRSHAHVCQGSVFSRIRPGVVCQGGEIKVLPLFCIYLWPRLGSYPAPQQRARRNSGAPCWVRPFTTRANRSTTRTLSCG